MGGSSLAWGHPGLRTRSSGDPCNPRVWVISVSPPGGDMWSPSELKAGVALTLMPPKAQASAASRSKLSEPQRQMLSLLDQEHAGGRPLLSGRRDSLPPVMQLPLLLQQRGRAVPAQASRQAPGWEGGSRNPGLDFLLTRGWRGLWSGSS